MRNVAMNVKFTSTLFLGVLLRSFTVAHRGTMDVVVVRLHSHGHRFELPCQRQKLEDYMKRGRAHPPDLTTRIIVHPSIFTNCHRKELATNASLQAAFQTTSFDAIAPTILQFGDIVANEKDRQEKKNEKKELQESVQRLTRTLLVNKFTGVSPDEADLREELKSAKEARCVEHVDPLLQAAFFASIIVRREHLDCTRVVRRMRVLFSVDAEAEWNDFLLDFDGLVLPRGKNLVAALADAQDEVADTVPTKVVELFLLYDASPELQQHSRWRAALAKTVAVAELPLEIDDTQVFSRYEFILPEAETATEVDLTNRLQALERMQRDSHDDDASRSPNKGRKGKRHVLQFDSDDEQESPKIKPAVVSKYDVMTHKQLQDLCKQYKLSSGGKKQDLIERLEAFDETTKPKQRH